MNTAYWNHNAIVLVTVQMAAEFNNMANDKKP